MPIELRERVLEKRRLPRCDDLLLQRAELLAREDRDLIEAVFLHGQPTAAIARMLGITPRAVRKRVHRLARRLASRRFLDAARALAYLPADEAKLAKMRFCQGVPQRRIAEQLGIPPTTLRRRLDRLEARIATIKQFRAAGKTLEPLAR